MSLTIAKPSSADAMTLSNRASDSRNDASALPRAIASATSSPTRRRRRSRCSVSRTRRPDAMKPDASDGLPRQRRAVRSPSAGCRPAPARFGVALRPGERPRPEDEGSPLAKHRHWPSELVDGQRRTCSLERSRDAIAHHSLARLKKSTIRRQFEDGDTRSNSSAFPTAPSAVGIRESSGLMLSPDELRRDLRQGLFEPQALGGARFPLARGRGRSRRALR